jgi:hypothetical protein
MDPRVSVADLSATSSAGTITIGREAFPQFAEMGARGVFVQSDRVRPAHPSPAYVGEALEALTEALAELGVPEAEIAFVETVPRPPSTGLRYGFQGAYTTDIPNRIWIFTDWTPAEDLRGVVRHEAAHLAFARTHTPEESEGHSGPSEDFARAFEVGRGGGGGGT